MGLVAAFGGAALFPLLIRPLRAALWAIGVPPPLAMMADCPVPYLCAFADPPGAALRLFVPDASHHAGLTLAERYGMSHGPWVVSLAIVALAARRVLPLRATGTLEPPARFAGFWLALAALGLFLVPFGYLGGWRLSWVVMHDPVHFGVVIAFLAWLMAEWPWPRRAPAAPAVGAPHGVGVMADPSPVSGRRRPAWTIAALLLPVGLTLVGFAGGIVGVFLGLGAGLALGAIATVVAIARKERWIALQVVAFLVNFGIGLMMLGGFAR